jgi:hypothetical protein
MKPSKLSGSDKIYSILFLYFPILIYGKELSFMRINISLPLLVTTDICSTAAMVMMTNGYVRWVAMAWRNLKNELFISGMITRQY